MVSRARRRRVAAAVVGVAVLVGPFAATGPATAEQAADLTLAYTCLFPSATHPVSARIAATFPDQGTQGEPIPVGDVRVLITLPAADFTAAGVASVTGVARLSLAGQPNDLGIPATPVAEGDLVLEATGAVPDLPPGKPGAVPVAVGDLGLELTLSKVDGSPAEPASLSVPCAVNPGQDTTLVSIPVPEPPSSSRPAPTTTTPPSRGGNDVPGQTRPEEPVPRVAAAPIPPECGVIPVPPGGRPGCAFIAGYTTIRKLGASLLVVPALANVAVVPPKIDGILLKADNPAELIGRRIPPLTGTFLVFGFVPIKATMELVQDGPINIHTEGRRQAPFTFTVTTIAKLSARVHDVTVNGVPLDVGPNCRPERSIDMVLTGGTPDYVNILRGGPQAGFVDIPPFTGCGVTEDLDPLLTRTVSGEGNRVKTIQGSVCSPPDQAHTFCPPVAPQLPPPGSF